MAKKIWRPHELDLAKRVGVTEEVHDILRKEKIKQKNKTQNNGHRVFD